MNFKCLGGVGARGFRTLGGTRASRFRSSDARSYSRASRFNCKTSNWRRGLEFDRARRAGGDNGSRKTLKLGAPPRDFFLLFFEAAAARVVRRRLAII